MIKKILIIPIISLCFIVITCGFTFNSKKLEVTPNNQSNKTPKEAYQVYLDGEVVGTIESKEELLNVIDKEQESLKRKFNVDKVYPPKGLDIRKIYTYNTKVDELLKYIQTPINVIWLNELNNLEIELKKYYSDMNYELE